MDTGWHLTLKDAERRHSAPMSERVWRLFAALGRDEAVRMLKPEYRAHG